MVLTVAVLVLNIILIGICAFTMNKLKNVHLLLYSTKAECNSQIENVFKQIESFYNLHLDLGFNKSLPFTRGWAGSPDFLSVISKHTLKVKPQVVVECSSGVSTLVLAKCLDNVGAGHVYSLDHDPVFAQKTRVELSLHGLSHRATVLDAPLRVHNIDGKDWDWYSSELLPENIEIDMLVIDGPPMQAVEMARYPAGPLLFKKINKTGVVFLDDASRGDEKKILQRWAREWPSFEQADCYCEKGCVQLKQL